MITDIENTWLIADTHWGHANIEHLCKRPANADALMLDEWRKLVPADALLIHLGDVVYRANVSHWTPIIHNLPGRKELILGNHDKQKPEYYERCGFEIIAPFEYLYGSRLITFDHYPLEEKAATNELRIHGHIHNSGYGLSSPARIGHCNVSVEVTRYRPVNLGTLLRAYYS